MPLVQHQHDASHSALSTASEASTNHSTTDTLETSTSEAKGNAPQSVHAGPDKSMSGQPFIATELFCVTFCTDCGVRFNDVCLSLAFDLPLTSCRSCCPECSRHKNRRETPGCHGCFFVRCVKLGRDFGRRDCWISFLGEMLRYRTDAFVQTTLKHHYRENVERWGGCDHVVDEMLLSEPQLAEKTLDQLPSVGTRSKEPLKCPACSRFQTDVLAEWTFFSPELPNILVDQDHSSGNDRFKAIGSLVRLYSSNRIFNCQSGSKWHKKYCDACFFRHCLDLGMDHGMDFDMLELENRRYRPIVESTSDAIVFQYARADDDENIEDVIKDLEEIQLKLQEVFSEQSMQDQIHDSIAAYRGLTADSEHDKGQAKIMENGLRDKLPKAKKVFEEVTNGSADLIVDSWFNSDFEDEWAFSSQCDSD